MTTPPDPSRGTFDRLERAIAGLGADSDFIAGCLADSLESIVQVRPVALHSRRREWLIESGALTRDELEEAERDIARGALVSLEAQTYLSFLRDTANLEEAAITLGVAPEKVTGAVVSGQLYAVTVAGQSRLPKWQFDERTPDHRLPGLSELISAASGLPWTSVQALMRTPQTELLAETTPQTPVEWLQAGGDVAIVREILDAYREAL